MYLLIRRPFKDIANYYGNAAAKMELAPLKRLVTHEDAKYFHIHKILGLSCLAHFIYRLIWPEFLISGWSTPMCILLHALLHVSSFQFILPSRRVKSYNIIWPEMRWHSMIFAYRSIFAMLMHWYWAGRQVPQEYFIILIFATMASADIVTEIYRRNGAVFPTTIRGNPFPAWTPTWLQNGVNLFYSMSQVVGTINIAFGNINHAFMILLPVQMAPFGMTLVKKGVISSTGWHILYMLALLANFFTLHFNHFIDRILVLLFCFGRFKLGINKYVLWLSVLGLRGIHI